MFVRVVVAMMIFESVMDHVARELSISPAALRERHLYQEGDVTHFVRFSCIEHFFVCVRVFFCILGFPLH